MTTTTVFVAAALTAASAGAPAPGKLSPDVSKEMMAAIVATNKALGLESWPMHDVKPCIDRGGQGITAKEVTPDETRKCAACGDRQGLPRARKVVRAGGSDDGDRSGHRAGDRDRRQRRLGRLLVRSRPQVPAGEGRRPQQMGQADRRTDRPAPARRRARSGSPPTSAPARRRARRTAAARRRRPRRRHAATPRTSIDRVGAKGSFVAYGPEPGSALGGPAGGARPSRQSRD